MGVISIKPRWDRVYNEQEKWDDFGEKIFVELATTGFHILAFSWKEVEPVDINVQLVDCYSLQADADLDSQGK